MGIRIAIEAGIPVLNLGAMRRLASASACWKSAGPDPLPRVSEKRAPGERPGGEREVVSLT